MERQQNQEGLSLARETAADFKSGEEAREQAEAYYTEASTYTASADDRFGRGGSINANEVAAFETFLVDHLSDLNGRRISTREAQQYWVGLTASDMGRAEQREVQLGFFESRLRAEPFPAPSGYYSPSGGGFVPMGDFSGPADQRASFAGLAESQMVDFSSNAPPLDEPRSAAVDARYANLVTRQSDVRDYVAGSADAISHQTAITNGEAHVQRYGLESYVEWAGGEENARIVLGDDRFDQLILEDAEKALEDRTLRSAK